MVPPYRSWEVARKPSSTLAKWLPPPLGPCWPSFAFGAAPLWPGGSLGGAAWGAALGPAALGAAALGSPACVGGGYNDASRPFVLSSQQPSRCRAPGTPYTHPVGRLLAFERRIVPWRPRVEKGDRLREAGTARGDGLGAETRKVRHGHALREPVPHQPTCRCRWFSWSS